MMNMSLWYIFSENSTSINQCKSFRVLYELKEIIIFRNNTILFTVLCYIQETYLKM